MHKVVNMLFVLVLATIVFIFNQHDANAQDTAVFGAYHTSLKAWGAGVNFRDEKSKWGLEGAYYFTGGEYETTGGRDTQFDQEFKNAFSISALYYMNEGSNSAYIGAGWLWFKMEGTGSSYGGDLRIEDSDLRVSSPDIFVGYQVGNEYFFDLRLGYLTDTKLKGEITVSADVGGTTYTETYDTEDLEDVELLDNVYFYIAIGYKF